MYRCMSLRSSIHFGFVSKRRRVRTSSVQVMPGFFFVLARMSLRVDDVIIRQAPSYLLLQLLPYSDNLKSVWLVVDDNFIHFHFMVISESSSRRFSQVDTRWLHVFGTNELVRESLKTKNIVDPFEIQLGEQKDICTIIKLVDTDEKTFCSYVRSEH